MVLTNMHWLTKCFIRRLNPVWTLSTGCFVLFRQSVDAFFETNHLVFEIRDHDTIGVHPTIGTVNVGKQGILSGTGERVEYKISLEGGFTDDRSNPVSSSLATLFCFRRFHTYSFLQSLLSLRFRHATKADIEFIEGYEKNRRRNKRAVFADESFLGPKIHSKLTLRKQTRKGMYPCCLNLVVQRINHHAESTFNCDSIVERHGVEKVSVSLHLTINVGSMSSLSQT